MGLGLMGVLEGRAIEGYAFLLMSASVCPFFRFHTRFSFSSARSRLLVYASSFLFSFFSRETLSTC